MENPRPEKVAVVAEVQERLAGSDGVILTEYRGLTVAELAELRRSLAAAGGDYKVYKNTLVRRAIAGGRQEAMQELLTGPTAIAFVRGDVSAVAKSLRDFSRSNPALVIKGGIAGGGLLSASEVGLLADLPPRDVLLAQFAGALAAPMRNLAGLMKAVPQSLAYGIAALLEKRRAEGPEEPAAPAESGEAPSAAAGETPAAEASAEAGAAETEAAGAPAEAEAEGEAVPAGAEAEAGAEAAAEAPAEAAETEAEAPAE